MKRIILHQKYYNFLFIAFFSIFIVVYGTIFYVSGTSYFSWKTKRQTSSNAAELETVAQKFSSIISDVDSYYLFLVNSSALPLKFLTDTSFSKTNLDEITTLLEHTKNLSTYVSSIVLYNYSEDVCIDIGDSLEMHDFLSVFMQNSAENHTIRSMQKYFFYYHSSVFSDPDDISYLSIIYYFHNKNVGKPYCIVFNLNLELLEGILFSETQIPACITNCESSIVASNADFSEYTYNIPVAWSSEINAGNSTGSFSYFNNDKKYMVSYCELSETEGWNCIVKTPHISNTFLPWQYLFLLLADILFSFITTILLTRTLYAPINRTLSTFDQTLLSADLSLQETYPRNADEFAYMCNIASILNNQLITMQQEKKTQLASLKNAFLQSLLFAQVSEKRIDHAWNVYEISVPQKFIRILLIHPDKSSAMVSEQLLSFSDTLAIGLEKHLQPFADYEWLLLGSSMFVVLFSEKNFSSEDFPIQTQLEELHRFLSVAANSVFTFVLDEQCYSAISLAQGYQNALKLFKERFILGYGQILSQSYIDVKLSTMTTFPDDLIDSIVNCVKKQDLTQFNICYQELVIFLNNYVYQDVIRVLIHLITQISDAIRSVTVHNQFLNMDFSSIDELFVSVQTLEETSQWFIQIFENFKISLQNSTRDKNDIYWKAIELAQQEIQENYHDPALSVESVSKHVGYSANYFSKLYKSLTGIYLKDYLKNVRINHAKQLLVETDFSINDISNMTGFTNQNYFFASFKKEIGITPATYRNQHKDSTTE